MAEFDGFIQALNVLSIPHHEVVAEETEVGLIRSRLRFVKFSTPDGRRMVAEEWIAYIPSCPEEDEPVIDLAVYPEGERPDLRPVCEGEEDEEQPDLSEEQ